jgi:site-specific DNA recombinase
MRLALYARVSTQLQEREETVASQIAELVDHAGRHGLMVPDECRFVDEGYSGSSLARPALDALRDKVAEGKFDAVLVFDPDRLSRSYVYQMLLLEEFERSGCALVFTRRPIGRSSDERLLLQMQSVIAEYERAKILERTRRGKLHRMRQGEIVSGRRTFGYKYFPKSGDHPARFETIPEEAEAVKRIFDWFVNDGLTLRAVAGRLASEKVGPTRGGRWTGANVRYILRNSMYHGTGHANRVEAVLPRQGRPLEPVYRKYPKTGKRERPPDEWQPFRCPAIIDEETFLLARDRLQANKELSARNTKSEHLLRGLIKCGVCGRRMQSHAHEGKYACRYTRRSVAEEFGLAVCANNARIPIAALDRAVWSEVAAMVRRPSALRKYHKRLRGGMLPKASSGGDPAGKRAKLEEQLRRVNDLYIREAIGRNEHAERIKRLKAELHDVTVRIEKLKAEKIDDEEVEQMLESFSRFASAVKTQTAEADFATRRHIVENMVKAVVIDKNSATIEYAAPLKRSNLCMTNHN